MKDYKKSWRVSSNLFFFYLKSAICHTRESFCPNQLVVINKIIHVFYAKKSVWYPHLQVWMLHTSFTVWMINQIRSNKISVVAKQLIIYFFPLLHCSISNCRFWYILHFLPPKINNSFKLKMCFFCCWNFLYCSESKKKK